MTPNSLENVKGGDKTKKVVILVLVVVLFLSNVHVTRSADTIRVLVDESRVGECDLSLKEQSIALGLAQSIDWRCSFDNEEQGWGFSSLAVTVRKVASLEIRKKGSLTYDTLKDYDVLVIASFVERYTSSEVDAIRQFVENGGGLLLLADSEFPHNSVSRAFDVQFDPEGVAVAFKNGESRKYFWISFPYIYWISPLKEYFSPIKDIRRHPVTKDIGEVDFFNIVPISSYGSGKVLMKTGKDTWADKIGEGMGRKEDDEDEGPFDIALAMEVGKGRAVFIGTSDSFWNMVTSFEDGNLDLFRNAVEWLGGPGGPYKQYRVINEQAQQTFTDAVTMFKNHQFSQAIAKFNEAIISFEESNKIYVNSEAANGIAEAEDYITKCETGIEANESFDNAQSLYDKHEYEKAIEEFEKARSLYEEIEYTARALECSKKVEKSNAWIALREKATQELADAETAFANAPSTFNPSEYENARTLFEKAKSMWQEYDDPEKVAVCQEKIDQCTSEIAKIKRNRIVTIIAVAVVIVVAIAVVIKRKGRRKEIKEGESAPPPPAGDEGKLKALSDRYIKGEITKEEYENLKSDLEKK